MDRLETPIKDELTIRNKGMFYTPTLFVDYAHKMISEQLGEDWKDKYVVWDNCCGTKNLTRDYHFKELYCSTLFDSELETGKRYNKEATTFQFDFLNDPLEKLPQGLRDAFEQDKPIVFFLNPPYARNTGEGCFAGTTESVKTTNINKIMCDSKLGNASSNLYAQFLYRILLLKQKYNLTNTYVCIFCPPLFLTGMSYNKFRKVFLPEFQFEEGILFQASHFADVSNSWGISFSMWSCGNTIDKHNFKCNIVDIIDNEVNIIGEKILYNAEDQVNMNQWIKNKSIIGNYELPSFKSGLSICSRIGIKGLKTNMLGTLCSFNNNVGSSTTGTAVFSGIGNIGNGNTFIITSDNFPRTSTILPVRKIVASDWINSKDEYLAPNEEHPQFEKFVNDSVIYSLFHSASNQSSLRQVEYKDKHWNIKNEFFWMGKDEIADLANGYQLDDVYEDAKTSGERFVYKYIQEHKDEFSPEAIAVLNKANELVRKSFKYRQLFAEEHPEYQVDKVWDAGYYQLKPIWKEYMKDEFNEFKALYKALADKMRPMVYELGFLKK